MQPYILNFAVKRKSHTQAALATTFDAESQVTVLIDQPHRPIVAEPSYAGVRTKKQDIEKGDDMKDTGPKPKPKPKPSPRTGLRGIKID